MNPQELLAQLQPPDAPAAIGWWPLAAGWWVLAALLLCALLAGAWWIWRQQRRAAPWKQALQLADRQFAEWQQHGNDSLWLQQSAVLLKRCMRQAGGDRDGSISLSGSALQHWLGEHCPHADVTLLEALTVQQYRPQPRVDASQLQPALRQLIADLQGVSRA